MYSCTKIWSKLHNVSMNLAKIKTKIDHTKVTPGLNNTLSTTVYRKPTHTSQYLHWNSSHFITAKHSVYNTLAHRAKVFFSDQHSLHQELEHIRMALQNCHFPKWALNKLQQNFQCRQHNHNETNSTDQ